MGRAHMEMRLDELLHIPEPDQYKVHLANWNGKRQPLDVFLTDKEAWKGWNSWRGSKDDFNRRYIFSLIDYYHEPDVWLFGGVYEVVERLPNASHSGKEFFLSLNISGNISTS